jgi:DNA-binding NarL/FixJ family response regulator
VLTTVSPARVGIVEDDVILRAWLQQTLEAVPGLMLIGVAGTLAEGRALAANGLDLLLVDLDLPDGNGVELIRLVRATDRHCRMLVVSVFGDVRNVVQAIQAGADGYLLKGAETAEVASAVRIVLAGGAPISPSVAGHILGRLRAQNDSDVYLEPCSKLSLTSKEVEILQALAKGLSFKEAASAHGISPHTVADHVKSIYRKLEVNSRGEAVFEGLHAGIITLGS